MKVHDENNIKDKSLFAFRAEVSSDVWAVLVRLTELGPFFVKDMTLATEGCSGSYFDSRVELRVWKVNPQFGPDQPYHIPATLDELRLAASEIVNCDVIHESLDYAERYTGERYYTPWVNNPSYLYPEREVRSYERRARRCPDEPPQR